MKKSLSLVLACMLVAIAVLSVVPAMADGKTVVTYWSNDRHDEAYMTAMIEKFNAEHEDIEIQMTIMTDNFEQSILLAYQGGEAPDLVGQAIDIKNFSEYGAIESLTPYIQADEEYQKVNEPFEHKYEGLNALGDDIYWVASSMRSGVRIEYNKDLVAAAGAEGIPATLDEYIALAKKITEAGAGSSVRTGGISGSPRKHTSSRCHRRLRGGRQKLRASASER